MIWRNKKIRYGLLAFIVCICLCAAGILENMTKIWSNMSSSSLLKQKEGNASYEFPDNMSLVVSPRILNRLDEKDQISSVGRYIDNGNKKSIVLRESPAKNRQSHLTAVHELFHAHMNQIYPTYGGNGTFSFCVFSDDEKEGFAVLMTYLYYKKRVPNSTSKSLNNYLSGNVSKGYQDKLQEFVNGVYNSQVNGGAATFAARIEKLTAQNVYDYLDELATLRGGVCATSSSKTNYDLSPSFGDEDEDDAGNNSSDNSPQQSSDEENISGGEVCYPEDDGGDSVASDDSTRQGSDGENVDGDGVCYPGDDEGSDSDSGNGSGKDSEDGADDDSYTVGDAIEDIAEQFAIVGPNIPHYRLLWVFSGESLTTIGGDLWDAATGVFSDSSGRLDKVKDSFEKAKSREWELE